MSVLDEASLVLIPSGYKSGKLYTQVPVPSYGAELVTNGDFATDLSGWTITDPVGVTVEWTANGVRILTDGTGGGANQAVLVIGKSYYLEFDYTAVSGSLKLDSIIGTLDTTKKYTLEFIATQTHLTFYRRSGAAEGIIDNVSVKEVLVAAADLDFTRSTTGTRVNPDGLIEDVSWNLITYSEDFSNAYWTKSGATVVSGQTDPNGNSGAFKLVEDTSTGQHRVYSDIGAGSLCNAKSTFDLSNGTIADTNSGTAKIEPMPNGFYRCSVTGTATSTGTDSFYFQLNNTGFSDDSYTGDGTSGVYIFGAQLNVGTLKTYLPTQGSLVNFPRIDYTNGCGQLLLEPQRTNLIPYSEDFSNAAWSKALLTISSNATTSPDGTVNADKLIPTVSTGNHYIDDTVVSGVNTCSFFAKKAGLDGILIYTNGANSGRLFDLNLGTIGSAVGFTPTDSIIEDYGNGWYKCSITVNMSGITNIRAYAAIDGTTFTLTGNGVDGIYLWGADVQAGSYPTSYIPTSGTSVTRTKDASSTSGLSSVINSVEGVFCLKNIQALYDDSTTLRSITINNNNLANRISLQYDNVSNQVQAQVTSGGSTVVNLTHVVADETALHSIAIRYKLNDFSFWVDGVEVATDTGGTTFAANTLNQLDFNLVSGSGAPFYGRLGELILSGYLTDTQMADLTTL